MPASHPIARSRATRAAWHARVRGHGKRVQSNSFSVALQLAWGRPGNNPDRGAARLRPRDCKPRREQPPSGGVVSAPHSKGQHGAINSRASFLEHRAVLGVRHGGRPLAGTQVRPQGRLAGGVSSLGALRPEGALRRPFFFARSRTTRATVPCLNHFARRSPLLASDLPGALYRPARRVHAPSAANAGAAELGDERRRRAGGADSGRYAPSVQPNLRRAEELWDVRARKPAPERAVFSCKMCSFRLPLTQGT